jgi:hypothetical protein
VFTGAWQEVVQYQSISVLVEGSANIEWSWRIFCST